MEAGGCSVVEVSRGERATLVGMFPEVGGVP
jgi:hypothetical protein